MTHHEWKIEALRLFDIHSSLVTGALKFKLSCAYPDPRQTALGGVPSGMASLIEQGIQGDQTSGIKLANFGTSQTNEAIEEAAEYSWEANNGSR